MRWKPIQPEVVPRAYFGGESLSNGFKFCIRRTAFVEFMHAAQETAYLEMAEIWLLKQMLQLVLLERFAEQTGDAALDGTAAARMASRRNDRSARH